ncbi:hypothetical protein [Rhodococcoides fascians]|uniref:hypothetical protein n=1 Tax=Rhodococcoides fascians TaxID=1828 RepID=UPI00050CEA9A|nr:hypothetical protein [Rhodococcus fascians]
MNLRLTILGREIAAITTEAEPLATAAPTKEDREREFAEWKARSDTNNGEFGFGRTDLTAIEEPERRWETGQRGEA